MSEYPENPRTGDMVKIETKSESTTFNDDGSMTLAYSITTTVKRWNGKEWRVIPFDP